MLGLMPMWLLSGSFFPIPAVSGESSWGQIVLGWMMRANPLSYSMAELRRLIYPAIDLSTSAFAPNTAGLLVGKRLGFAVATTGLAWRLMRGSRRADITV